MDKPFTGVPTTLDAANAIRASRLTAQELLDTAELLFALKRFAHSMALSVLAIEEASKSAILFSLVISREGEHGTLWKSYRNHRAKTSWLNHAIESRVRATYPKEFSREEAKQVARAGPMPDQLEKDKQRAVYSDCLEVSGEFVAHCPSLAEWRQSAWERLCEAQAMISGLRDRPPAELEIWQRYAAQARARDIPLAQLLPELHRELLEAGLVREGQWETLLEDVRAELSERDADDNEKL